MNSHSSSYWIGYNKLITSNWSWIDDTPATYTNWIAGKDFKKVENVCLLDKGTHECAKIKPDGGTWK